MLEFANLEKFRDLVLASDDSFMLECTAGSGRRDWYIQGRLGNAKFVYCVYLGCDKIPSASDQLEMAAVEAGGVVYLAYPVYAPGDEPLPSGVRWLQDLCHELGIQALEIIAQHKADLAPADPSDVMDLSRIPLDARKLALNPELEEYADGEPIFSKSLAVELLAGETKFEDVVADYCKKYKKAWAVKKRRAIMIQEYLDQPGVIEPWEYAMSDALRNVDAQLVLLELGWPGNTVSAKIEPSKVMERLVESWSFRSYDFAVEKSGAKILKILAEATGRNKDHFYCKDVLRIMFRGKAIYDRDAVDG